LTPFRENPRGIDALLAHVRFLDRTGHFQRLSRLNELHIAMLAYLSKWEDELEINRRDEDFKNLVFAQRSVAAYARSVLRELPRTLQGRACPG
jgi:hypothetical protein